MRPQTINKWEKIITDQKQSGQSIQAWCEENKVSTTAFYKNRKLLLSEIEKPKSLQTSNFQEVIVIEEKTLNRSTLKLHLTDKIYLELKSGFDQNLLKEIIEAIHA